MTKLLTELRHIARTAGECAALSGEQDRYTYRGLLAAVDGLAEELIQLGSRRVALLADNSPAWVIADLACLRAGVALIPIPGFFSAAQLANTLRSSGAEILISDRTADDTQLQGVLASKREVSGFNGLPQLRVWPLEETQQTANLPVGTVKITYTSGSTGAPKGVCLSAENLLATATALNSALLATPLRRHLVVLPLATLLENVAGVYAALLRGAEVVMPSLQTLGWAGSSGLDVQALSACLSDVQPDSAVLLPQLLKGLIALAEQGQWQPPTSLQFLAVGGARVAPEQITQARQLGLPVYEGYGLSECGSVVSLNTPSAERAGCAGKILDHCQLDIVDGQVMVKGNVYLAYLGSAEPQSENTVATGDLGELDEDGFLWLKGRSKNVLVSSYGRNISPEWPESELLAYAGVAQCLVIGDAEAYCSALIFVTPSYRYDDIGRYIRECNQRLPDYAQIRRWAALPRRLSVADGLLTANGRLRRQAIIAAYPELVAHCYPSVAYPFGGVQRAYASSQHQSELELASANLERIDPASSGRGA
ncbi:MAG: AMP-binding protein [Zhongshania sp.]|uniref:AMP-binding protein n=1 Tax=Zhongshania sp. TaxID=1971902 RepID=UPI00262A2B49|nr:AMP-binding protein [Zhongshania sp.]MDF1692659.1 AMP-binding protein [Zhongshania sp.]